MDTFQLRIFHDCIKSEYRLQPATVQVINQPSHDPPLACLQFTGLQQIWRANQEGRAHCQDGTLSLACPFSLCSGAVVCLRSHYSQASRVMLTYCLTHQYNNMLTPHQAVSLRIKKAIRNSHLWPRACKKC